MRLNIFGLFHKSKSPMEVKSDSTLTLDLKKISKQREIPILHQYNISPVLRVKQDKVLKKSTSMSSVRQTINKLKRSTSLNKFYKAPTTKHKLNTIKSLPMKHYQEDNYCSESIYEDTNQALEIIRSTTSSIELYNTTIPEHDDSEFYSNIFSDYCETSEDYSHINENCDMSSTITSFDWNKENIPPFTYPLSASKLPNTPIIPKTPKVQQYSTFSSIEDPFLDTNLLLPPHRFFINKETPTKMPQRDIHPITPNKNDEIMYYAFSNISSSCKSTPKHYLKNKPSFLNFSPKPTSNLPSLPSTSSRALLSTASANFISSLSALANEPNINQFDIEEKSLLEALSTTELYDCSKVAFISYNS